MLLINSINCLYGHNSSINDVTSKYQLIAFILNIAENIAENGFIEIRQKDAIKLYSDRGAVMAKYLR